MNLLNNYQEKLCMDLEVLFSDSHFALLQNIKHTKKCLTKFHNVMTLFIYNLHE